MGKGTGCVNSKSAKKDDVALPVKSGVVHPETRQTGPTAIPGTTGAALSGIQTTADSGGAEVCRIFVVYYSTYGHIEKMAQSVADGINSVAGCRAQLFQVAETLSPDVLAKMHAPPKSSVPVIEPSQLAQAGGIVFGFPTRFGTMANQMKAFFDATGGLWQCAALLGKPVTAFTSTGTQGGGQETTLWTAATQFAHHGMIYVPPGYTVGKKIFGSATPHGGGPFGAGCLAAADGTREPSEYELKCAFHQGQYFSGKAKKLV